MSLNYLEKEISIKNKNKNRRYTLKTISIVITTTHVVYKIRRSFVKILL